MTHICPGTWSGTRNESSETPALNTAFNYITDNSTALETSFITSSSSSFTTTQNTETESNDGTAAAENSYSPAFAPITRAAFQDISSFDLPPAFLGAYQGDPFGDNESSSDSDDSSSTVVPRAPTPRPQEAGEPAEAPTDPAPENTRVNGVPEPIEPFPDFVDSSARTSADNSLSNEVTGVTTTTTTEAPLPSAEVLARRPRREEFHYSDQVRGNILAGIFGRSAVDERGRLSNTGGSARSSAHGQPSTTTPVFGPTSSAPASRTSRGQASSFPSEQRYISYGQASTFTNGQTASYGQRSTANQTFAPSGQASSGAVPYLYRRVTHSTYGRGSNPNHRRNVAETFFLRPQQGSYIHQTPASGQSPSSGQAVISTGSSATAQTTSQGQSFTGEAPSSDQAPASSQATASTSTEESTSEQSSTSSI